MDNFRKVYLYNEDYIFISETEEQLCPIRKNVYNSIASATSIKPINYNEKTEFLKFDIETNNWVKYELIDESKIYYNKSNGLATNLKKHTLDISSYTDIEPPYFTNDDNIKFVGDQWQYINLSNETKKILLNKYKEEKIKEVEDKYNACQYVKIVNGITFYMPIRGDLFNITLPLVIRMGQGRKDNLSYLRVMNSINNIEYVGKLPYDLLNDIYQKTYDISINNNNNKHAFIKEINAKQEVEDIKNYSFNYISIQTININKLINEYLENSNNEIGKDYLKEIGYKVFKEIVIEELVTLN